VREKSSVSVFLRNTLQINIFILEIANLNLSKFCIQYFNIQNFQSTLPQVDFPTHLATTNSSSTNFRTLFTFLPLIWMLFGSCGYNFAFGWIDFRTPFCARYFAQAASSSLVEM